MLKYAGPILAALITDLINQILTKGIVPETLSVGTMTLIDKKDPSLFEKQKHPFTVLCMMFSIITKVIHGRMDKICEAKVMGVSNMDLDRVDPPEIVYSCC